KQGVAAEQPGLLWVVAIIGNMIQSVTGHRHDLQFTSQQAECVAIRQDMIDPLDALVGGPPDLATGGRLEGEYPSGMVPVMVGQQNAGQLIIRMSAQPADNRPCVAGIDRDGLEGIFIPQQPYIVVLEGA